jgi:ketosteroid isomerase-like protein
MSQENVDVVRGYFDAVARRDLTTAFADFDPAVEWDVSQGSLGELLGGKIYRGPEGLREVFRELYEAWDGLELRLDESIDAGDENVIGVVTASGRGRTSGIEVKQTQAAVWTFSKAKIVRVVWFSTRTEALEAVGLAE